MSMESRVILVHTYYETGLNILRIAKSLNMTKRGYVWIATSWLSTILDSTSIPPKDATTLQGVLGLRPYTAIHHIHTAKQSFQECGRIYVWALLDSTPMVYMHMIVSG